MLGLVISGARMVAPVVTRGVSAIAPRVAPAARELGANVIDLVPNLAAKGAPLVDDAAGFLGRMGVQAASNGNVAGAAAEAVVTQGAKTGLFARAGEAIASGWSRTSGFFGRLTGREGAQVALKTAEEGAKASAGFAWRHKLKAAGVYIAERAYTGLSRIKDALGSYGGIALGAIAAVAGFMMIKKAFFDEDALQQPQPQPAVDPYLASGVTMPVQGMALSAGGMVAAAHPAAVGYMAPEMAMDAPSGQWVQRVSAQPGIVEQAPAVNGAGWAGRSGPTTAAGYGPMVEQQQAALPTQQTI